MTVEEFPRVTRWRRMTASRISSNGAKPLEEIIRKPVQDEDDAECSIPRQSQHQLPPVPGLNDTPRKTSRNPAVRTVTNDSSLATVGSWLLNTSVTATSLFGSAP